MFILLLLFFQHTFTFSILVNVTVGDIYIQCLVQMCNIEFSYYAKMLYMWSFVNVSPIVNFMQCFYFLVVVLIQTTVASHSVLT